ncbi:hypothetical protein [Rhizobium sp. BK176]|uniref:hypothetical protein n=1 Tax=Rhizobium sp. BK176 TaxID=2587071 RepID=UPI0021672F43|nr:hypothetical protein [Rhizobium sp. BK176]MCS4089360.1 hypothetical protein [Rhizobium sp. BK176]
MNELYKALASIKAGYEAGKTLFDSDMIEHAETVANAHDVLIDALAKSHQFDGLLKHSVEGRSLVLDTEWVDDLKQDVARHVERIASMHTEPQPAAGAPDPKI